MNRTTDKIVNRIIDMSVTAGAAFIVVIAVQNLYHNKWALSAVIIAGFIMIIVAQRYAYAPISDDERTAIAETEHEFRAAEEKMARRAQATAISRYNQVRYNQTRHNQTRHNQTRHNQWQAEKD